jgi:hypothetical protein
MFRIILFGKTSDWLESFSLGKSKELSGKYVLLAQGRK